MVLQRFRVSCLVILSFTARDLIAQSFSGRIVGLVTDSSTACYPESR